MSKSKGNVIYADELANRFGTDAVRYYLLREMPFAQDGNITYESFINLFNSDLANTLGNLVNRSIAMANKYFDGKVKKGENDALGNELVASAKEAVEKYFDLMDKYRNADAVDAVMSFAKRCNKYIDETAPWALAKDESKKAELENVLYNLLEGIRLLSVMLLPIIPASSEKIKAQLCTSVDSFEFGEVCEYSVGIAEPLFARIDLEKTLEEIAAEQAKNATPNPIAEEMAGIAQIGIDDFAKVDLRAAKITACESVKKAKKLLKLTLDDGTGTERTVASGIALHYKPEELIGKTVVLVANLKPATLCGVESCGMILAATDGDAVKVIFLDGVTPGSKIS